MIYTYHMICQMIDHYTEQLDKHRNDRERAILLKQTLMMWQQKRLEYLN